ncbi:MAG: hypothetical protein QMC96_04335 [Methanomicrobiales archaeon]|nr:hypothetical protein [Methanomicrobiales archaeon]
MPEEEEPSLYWILFQRYAGLLVFLAIVGLLNLMTLFVVDATFQNMVSFINESLVLIFTISIIYFAGMIVRILPFPLNLPAPVLIATSSVFLVVFLINAFLLVDTMLGVQLFQLAPGFLRIALVAVFAGVLGVGYIHLIGPLIRSGDRRGITLFRCRATEDRSREEKESISWEDVNRELRYAIFDVPGRIRSYINRKIDLKVLQVRFTGFAARQACFRMAAGWEGIPHVFGAEHSGIRGFLSGCEGDADTMRSDCLAPAG